MGASATAAGWVVRIGVIAVCAAVGCGDSGADSGMAALAGPVNLPTQATPPEPTAPTALAPGVPTTAAPGVPTGSAGGAAPAPSGDPADGAAGTDAAGDTAGGGDTTEAADRAAPDAGTGSALSPDGNLVRGPEPTAQSATAKGPYTVESTTAGLADPPEYGTQTLWYPTDADPPFASIAIVPGFVSPESSIANWGPFLASHGIVVLTIGTNSGGDSPEIRSAALLAALDTIKAEHVRSGGPIEGKLDTARLAVGGWSMGGGGTLLTANTHPELKAAMAICPWYTTSPFRNVTVPTLMFAGTADVLAGGMSQGFYAAIPESTPKTIFEIAGADHFYANDPIGANNQVGKYGLSWLKVFLEGDERYRQFLLDAPTGASDFRTTVE